MLPGLWRVTKYQKKKKFEFLAATALFLHEQALFCLHAWASVRECGLGLGSGSRQHMPDTALWGRAFIPSCFHSPTFGRCTEKVFFQVFTFQEKRVRAFAFAPTWIWGLSSWYLTCFSYAASTRLTTTTMLLLLHFPGYRTSRQTTVVALSNTCLNHLFVKRKFRATEKHNMFRYQVISDLSLAYNSQL